MRASEKVRNREKEREREREREQEGEIQKERKKERKSAREIGSNKGMYRYYKSPSSSSLIPHSLLPTLSPLIHHCNRQLTFEEASPTSRSTTTTACMLVRSSISSRWMTGARPQASALRKGHGGSDNT